MDPEPCFQIQIRIPLFPNEHLDLNPTKKSVSVPNPTGHRDKVSKNSGQRAGAYTLFSPKADKI